MGILWRLNRWMLYAAILALLAYGVLLLINLNDRPPSATVLEFREALENRPALADRENAYVYMFGFGVPPEEDPTAAGRKRIEWLRAQIASETFDVMSDPLADDYNWQQGRSEEVAALAEACDASAVQCADAVAAAPAAATEWLGLEAPLLTRYSDLLTRPGFLNDTTMTVESPIPPYHVVLEGQRLLLVSALLSARDGDAARATLLLSNDLSFWRMVLKDADSLIDKMIATRGTERSFIYGNEVLRALHAVEAGAALPEVWLAPISDEERSMRRTLIGEWQFMDHVAMKLATDFDSPASMDEDVGRLEWRLYLPLYQPQDNSNRYAELMRQHAEMFDVPFAEVPEAYRRSVELSEADTKPFRRAYNIVGDWLNSIGQARFATYSVRVTDLEGIRRAAVVAATLRAQGVDVDDAATALSIVKAGDPYRNAPFAWDAESKSVHFIGLAPGNAGSFLVRY